MNKYRPHVYVLPEDDANRQIANGFLLNPYLSERVIGVLPPAGGWRKVLEAFRDEHVREMRRFTERRIILLMDFDEQVERLSSAREEIPGDLSNRVFILGVLSNPERLKTALGKSFEDIGKALAQDCARDTRYIWEHDLLAHNSAELDHMDSPHPSIRELLFPQDTTQ